MNYLKHVLITFVSIVVTFSLVTYTACNKDECEGINCLNGGVCYSGECACLLEYEGLLCEKSKNPCSNINCQNGGTCKDGNCTCPTGYYGLYCENKVVVDSCNYIKCLNGGVCVDGTCECLFGYTGRYCSGFLKTKYFKQYTGGGYDDKGNEYKGWYMQPSQGGSSPLSFTLNIYNGSQGIIVSLPARLLSENTYIIDEYDSPNPVTTYKGDGAISTSKMSLVLYITDAGGTTKLTFENMNAK